MVSAASGRAISALVVGPAEELELMLPTEARYDLDRAEARLMRSFILPESPMISF